jgi:ABC-type xylose transport system permease subunit
MSILNRLNAPTPKFFRKLRNIGLMLAAAGGVIVTSPISLPALVVTIGGYLTVAGAVVSAVSQATVKGEGIDEWDEEEEE